jgi:hypothetical protein
MPKPGRPVIEPTEWHFGMTVGVVVATFFLGLAACLLEATIRSEMPGAQCWHGMQIGSNDRC